MRWWSDASASDCGDGAGVDGGVLTGLFWAEAEQVLGATGWSGSVVKEPDVAAGEYSANQIAFQSPAPGQPVEATTKITVRFAQ